MVIFRGSDPNHVLEGVLYQYVPYQTDEHIDNVQQTKPRAKYVNISVFYIHDATYTHKI